MKRRLIAWSVGGAFIYAATYATLFACRSPAANLAYWSYTTNSPEWIEEGLYLTFYPAYWIHRKVLHVRPHTWDREPASQPTDDSI